MSAVPSPGATHSEGGGLSWNATPEEAAFYLLRHGRPTAFDDQRRRTAPSLVADRHYREEVARDARTLLTDGVDRALFILARNDDAGAPDA